MHFSRLRILTVLIALSMLAAACGGDGADPGGDVAAGDDTTTTTTTTATTTTTTTTTTVPEPSVLQINDLRLLGSHNSFHLRPEPVAYAAINLLSSELAEAIDYSHLPLTEQLETYGVRQFELDVFADPAGGLYASRAALPVIGLPAESGIPELDEPGFKVIHTQDFDFETTCLTLQICLAEMAAWSDANPDHLPVMVLIELKELSVPEAAAAQGVDVSALDIEWTIPVVTDESVLAAIDAELVAGVGRDRIITPDDVRAGAATLEEVILADGWPTVDEARGKIMFALNNTGGARDIYRAPSDVLEGRIMFTSSDAGSPDAAFIRVDDPIDGADLIAELAAAGYLIRTRADTPTNDARTGATERREAALVSGAHYLSTDYYVENADFGTGYVVVVEDRCNPVTAPPDCNPASLAD